MRYLDKFKNFFKKTDNKPSFDRILINLKKIVDEKAPDEVICELGVINIADVSIFNNEDLRNIVIKLIQDDNNFAGITIEYNSKYKFDMITWESYAVFDGQRYDSLQLDGIDPDSSSTDDNSLYSDIRNFLVDQKMVGPIFSGTGSTGPR